MNALVHLTMTLLWLLSFPRLKTKNKKHVISVGRFKVLLKKYLQSYILEYLESHQFFLLGYTLFLLNMKKNAYICMCPQSLKNFEHVSQEIWLDNCSYLVMWWTKVMAVVGASSTISLAFCTCIIYSTLNPWFIYGDYLSHVLILWDAVIQTKQHSISVFDCHAWQYAGSNVWVGCPTRPRRLWRSHLTHFMWRVTGYVHWVRRLLFISAWKVN